MHKNRLRKNSKRKKMIPLIVIIVLFFILLALELTGKTSFILNKNKNEISTVDSKEKNAKTTSKEPSAQKDFSQGDDRTPQAGSAKPEGAIKDDRGTTAATPPSSQWNSSSGDVITLYSPSSSSVVSKNTKISGKSSTPRVNYRVIDDVSGVIAQGELSVISGTFSGTFDLDSTGTNGRLDIFTTRADGVEENNIEIPIRFK